MLDEKEQQLWDVYYSGVVGWSLHPRNLEKDKRFEIEARKHENDWKQIK